MDKKKLLLVAISVGIFLVIAIGAAILVFAPKTASPQATASYPASGNRELPIQLPPVTLQPPSVVPEALPPNDAEPAAPDPVDIVRNSGDVPGLVPPPETSVRQDDFYVNGTAQTQAAQNSGEAAAGNETVINVPKPRSVAVPDAPPAGRAVPAPKPVVSAPKPAPVPAAKPAAPAAKPVSKPAPQPTKLYNDYWVQAGAFSTVANAEGAKENLASKGITSIIENREVDGKTMFRVRIGPYTSQNEADYWLSLIKNIDGFNDSQVRLTQSRR
jgi:DedD protein